MCIIDEIIIRCKDEVEILQNLDVVFSRQQNMDLEWIWISVNFLKIEYNFVVWKQIVMGYIRFNRNQNQQLMYCSLLMFQNFVYYWEL